MRASLGLTIAALSVVGVSSVSCSSSDPGTGGTGGDGGDTTSASTTSSGNGGTTCKGGHLDSTLAWYGTNRAQLDAMMDTKGCNGPGYDASKPPIAVFDWDNTVIKNDVGDATTFFMLAHDLVLQPPNKDWSTVSSFLTIEARQDLSAACDALANPGDPLPTSKADAANVACADVLFSIYSSGSTVSIDPATSEPYPAFTGYNPRRTEPAYAFAAQLQRGYSPDEIKVFAGKAITDNLASAVDAKQTIGSNTATFWIRIYDQVKDLIAKLQDNGFDVWVVSASPEPVVRAFSGKVGIAEDHVVGIRLVPGSDGKLTSTIESCGGEPVITYMDGKRCWINQAILGITTNPFGKAPDAVRQVFGAGDSTTDVTFVNDATTMALALNRNKKELMCHAYWDYNVKKTGKWLINPMFIEPKAQQTSKYPCSTTACIDDTGAGVPCVDDQGATIPDQDDTVFAP